MTSAVVSVSARRDRSPIVAVPPVEQRAAHRAEPLPITGPYPPLLAVMAAHGGAGASTLARWWAHAADAGTAWPACAATTQRVVLAARLCQPGLTAAATRLREWHAGLAPDGVEVAALVLTAARPGRVPAEVRRYRHLVTDLIDGRVHEIGWHDELLVHDLDDLAPYTPHDPPPPRRAGVTRAVPADVHRAAEAITAQVLATRTPRRTP
ncbi:hypothetical protein IU487_35570 [Nocardia puris]|uniref:hypothetical protein n=1 Tax=Nocardia puris TaxID=208602 RepID=UPI0018947D16|nr:hypothetical protein [Nocardia puris]MBF6216312.1 hypothetical protein [Nocardia puris]